MSDARFSCGAIVFMRDGQYVPIMGEERTALLRKAYRREPLPDGLVLAGDRGIVAVRPITWAECRWDTCGERVTA
jgi:hypothetical protein